VTMPPSSPRSSTRPPSPTTSSMMVGRGSTAPVPCLSPWKPAWRGSSGSRPGSHHLPFACTHRNSDGAGSTPRSSAWVSEASILVAAS
jgi:hypothetical protein